MQVIRDVTAGKMGRNSSKIKDKKNSKMCNQASFVHLTFSNFLTVL